MSEFKKFVQFSKVNEALREVSGIVTAEQPDKDMEVCDYEKSKPYYKALIEEMQKATEGSNCMPLRAMHQLKAVGKGIGFHFDDTDKEIEMTFKVVDDESWKLVKERVYTGFSQGGKKIGDQVPDPVFKGCSRYVANPSEVSLVDNPCLGAAHFAYIKADGSVEMKKFLKTEAPQVDRIVALEASNKELVEQVSLLKAAGAPADTGKTIAIDASKIELAKEATKRVGGKDLPASAFAYVGDESKTETWKFPVHDAAHARNALARFNQAKGIPAGAKGRVHSRIVAAAKKFGVDVSSEHEKIAAITATMRKAARVYVNQHLSTIKSQGLLGLDIELGKLAKGMHEVSRLACTIEELACQMYGVCCEQEWELDEESALPQMLADNVTSITQTFLEMVDEETNELLAHVRARVA